MEQDEQRAYEQFRQQKDLLDKEPAFAAAFAVPAEELDKGRRRARALYDEGPDFTLSTDGRTELGTERFPELQGVAALFSRALLRHPEIEKDTPARPAFFDRAVKVDQGLSRMVWVGHLYWRGGENGELLTGAAAQAACQGILQQADTKQGDPSLSVDQKNAVKSVFTEPRRLVEEVRARRAREKESAKKTEAPLQKEISQAEESAAMARVVEAFLAVLRRTP